VIPPYTSTSTSKNLQDSLRPPPTQFHQNIATHHRPVSHSQSPHPIHLSPNSHRSLSRSNKYSCKSPYDRET
jgi:hypothetical protein